MSLWSLSLALHVTILALKSKQTPVAMQSAQQGGRGGKGSGNSATQGITQGQSNAQNAICVSGALTSPHVTILALKLNQTMEAMHYLNKAEAVAKALVTLPTKA